MNIVEVGKIYTADKILRNPGRDIHILIKNKGKNLFLEDISIFIKSPSDIQEGDKFKIDSINGHSKQVSKQAKGYYVYSSISCDVHKVTEDDEDLKKVELKDLW